MVILGVYGYFILEAALLVGLPGGLYVFLMKFLGLSLTAMLVILVMQNRNDVADWLRGDRPRPEPPGLRALGVVRRRFADFWHVAAIILIVGVFLTWALDIEGGMVFLLSGLVMTLVTGPQASAEAGTELVSESEASQDAGEDSEHASSEGKAEGRPT